MESYVENIKSDHKSEKYEWEIAKFNQFSASNLLNSFNEKNNPLFMVFKKMDSISLRKTYEFSKDVNLLKSSMFYYQNYQMISLMFSKDNLLENIQDKICVFFKNMDIFLINKMGMYTFPCNMVYLMYVLYKKIITFLYNHRWLVVDWRFCSFRLCFWAYIFSKMPLLDESIAIDMLLCAVICCFKFIKFVYKKLSQWYVSLDMHRFYKELENNPIITKESL